MDKLSEMFKEDSTTVYKCTQCGYQSKRVKMLIHTYFGWNWLTKAGSCSQIRKKINNVYKKK